MNTEIDRIQRPKPKIPQYALHLWTIIAYVKRLQIAPYPHESNILDKKVTKRIQFIVVTVLYYACSVDPTILQAINELSRVQSKPTNDTN